MKNPLRAVRAMSMPEHPADVPGWLFRSCDPWAKDARMALETAAAAGRNCCKRAAEPGWRSALQSLVTPARVWAWSPQGGGSALALALGHDIKGKRSAPLGLAGIVLASVDSWISDAIYVLVAPMRLIPDRRIERAVQQ